MRYTETWLLLWPDSRTPPHHSTSKNPPCLFFIFIFLFLKTKIIVGYGRPWLKVDKTGHSLLCIVKRIISPLKINIYYEKNLNFWYDIFPYGTPACPSSRTIRVSDDFGPLFLRLCAFLSSVPSSFGKQNKVKQSPNGPPVSLSSQWFYHSMSSSHHFMVSFVQWQVPQTYQAFYVSGVRINNSYWYDISTLTTLPPQP